MLGNNAAEPDEVILSGEYTNPVTGVSFPLPDGFSQSSEPFELNDTISVAFSSPDDARDYFTYSSMDLWGSLSDDDKADVTRSDMNNDQLSAADKRDLAAALGQDELDTEVYGGREFFCMDMDMELEGMPLSCRVYMHLYNGYMNYFYFLSDGEDYAKSVLGNLYIEEPTEEEEETTDVSEIADDMDITISVGDLQYDSEEESLSEFAERTTEENVVRKSLGRSVLSAVIYGAVIGGLSTLFSCIKKSQKKAAAQSSGYTVPNDTYNGEQNNMYSNPNGMYGNAQSGMYDEQNNTPDGNAYESPDTYTYGNWDEQ